MRWGEPRCINTSGHFQKAAGNVKQVVGYLRTYSLVFRLPQFSLSLILDVCSIHLMFRVSVRILKGKVLKSWKTVLKLTLVV